MIVKLMTAQYESKKIRQKSVFMHGQFFWGVQQITLTIFPSKVTIKHNHNHEFQKKKRRWY